MAASGHNGIRQSTGILPSTPCFRCLLTYPSAPRKVFRTVRITCHGRGQPPAPSQAANKRRKVGDLLIGQACGQRRHDTVTIAEASSVGAE